MVYEALLVSGGVDSFIAYHWLKATSKREIHPIYIHYGGKYCDKEWEVVQNQFPNVVKNVGVFNFSSMEKGAKAYIPHRNLYMLALAASEFSTVWFGGLKDDNVGDKSAAFCHALSTTLSLSSNTQISVDSPFWHKTKSEIVKWLIAYCGRDRAEKLLLETVSCYDPTEHHCGQCPSCYRKFCAFTENRINIKFTNVTLAMEYWKNRSSYDSARRTSIIRATRKLRLI